MSKRKFKKSSATPIPKKHRLTVKGMLAIGKRIRKSIKGPLVDHAELLYDENGLPK